MRHAEQLRPGRESVKGWTSMVALALVILVAACDSDPTVLPAPRFAQVGEIQIDVTSFLLEGTGRIDEALLWRSEGGWVFIERMSYRGRAGPSVIRQSRANPGELAPQYATLIRELNEAPGLQLPGAVPTTVNPECEAGRSRITVTLRDTFRGEDLRWVRCMEGTFFSMTPASAGPDPQASRVVTAAQITRSFTLGEVERSSFIGTVPFFTLAEGKDSPASPAEPRSFISHSGSAPSDFVEFWRAHAGQDAPLPVVEWGSEMVILAAVGRRREAGGGVEVRRILPIGVSTRVEILERVPGDFCSPGAVSEHPFHLVVAPLVTLPVGFADVRVDRVPCGV